MADAPARPALLDRLPVVLALAAFLLVVPAGMMGLIEPGETRVAEIAREMRASGDWVLPRLDGLLTFRTPPLAPWATAVGLGAFGPNAWGARVPVALAALATLLATALAARRRFGALVRSPALAAWLLLSAALFAIGGRAVGVDPYVAATTALWWALAPSPWACALLGLGLLAGGPAVLVATLLPVLLAAAWRRDRAPLALLGPLWGWALTTAIALPWFAAIAARAPGALVEALLAPLWARGPDAAPAWYAPAVLVAGALPWTPALLAGLAHAWRERARAEARLLLLWLALPLAAIAVSGARAPAALLAALPAAALLAALGFERGGRVVRHATGLLLLVLAGAAWIAVRHLFGRLIGLDPPEAFRAPLGVWLALAALALAAFRIGDGPPARAAFLVAVGLTAGLVSLARFDRALGSPRAVVELLRQTRAAGEPVVEVAVADAGLPFHLGEPVRLLDAPADARFDDAATRARVCVTRDTLAALAADHGRVWLYGSEPRIAGIADSLGLGWTRVATWKDRAVGFVAR